MARLTKTMLMDQMIIKIHNMEMLCIEIVRKFNYDYNDFKKNLTLATIEDALKDLSDGEDALYIIRSKLGKD